MVPNEKRGHYLTVKEISALLRAKTNITVFIISIVIIFLKQQTNLSFTKNYVKIKIFV